MLDYQYICQKISDMAGLPIRVYEDKKLVYFYCFITLQKDPCLLCIDNLLEKNASIDYYVSDNTNYYGILNSNNLKIIIGPSLNPTITNQQLYKMAFDLNIEPNLIDDYIKSLKTLVKMPLSSILQILCTLNYVFNGEKVDISNLEGQNNELLLPDEKISEADAYRSINIEEKICSFIMDGDIDGFHLWIKQAPTIKEGKVADNYLRQNKNIFIVSATIFSRSAITAGLSPETALQISDYFIQKCESLSSQNDILTLQVKMIERYIEEVASLSKITENKLLAKQVYNIIKNNISSNIDTEMIAKELGYSRSYLSTIFKKENDIGIKEFIIKIKIEEAKKLLKNTNNSLTSIAHYLGFNSSSHFSKTFKSIVGITALTYRNNK